MTDIVRETLAQLVANTTRMASTPVPPLGYGVDLICVSDVTPRLDETDPNSYQSIGQDLFHRITTKKPLVDAPDWGIDIRASLSVGQTPQQIQSWTGQISNELRKDDRVDDVDVQIAFQAPSTYLITISVTPLDPAITDFTLIISVTDGEALLEAIQANPT